MVDGRGHCLVQWLHPPSTVRWYWGRGVVGGQLPDRVITYRQKDLFKDMFKVKLVLACVKTCLKYPTHRTSVTVCLRGAQLVFYDHNGFNAVGQRKFTLNSSFYKLHATQQETFAKCLDQTHAKTFGKCPKDTHMSG